jgi:hypothetical protein
MAQVYGNIRIEKAVNEVQTDQVSDCDQRSSLRRVLIRKLKISTIKEVRVTTYLPMNTPLIGQLDVLTRLHPVSAGFHDADVAGSTCLSGTRVALLNEIRAWFEDGSDKCPRLFWLFEIAGTGKTTVAQSVCEMLSRHLAGSFFFSCDRTERQRPSNILSSVRWH